MTLDARARFFIAVARLSSRLPAFRGRTRIFLELYRLLGLQHRHVAARARLREPVAFNAELDLHSWLQRVAFLTGGYESDTTQFLVQLYALTGAEGYLLDVGANIGLIAIPFARMRDRHTPRVICAEAVPDNVRALRRNLALNQLERDVLVLPYALGDERKTAMIQVEGDLRAGEGSGTANILADDTTHECVRQEITVETLDSLVAAGAIAPRCTVIKIDTDGYDLKVLQGGRAFLHRDRPVIFGEFSAHCLAWHNQSLHDVLAFAASIDYAVWRRLMPNWKFTPAHENDAFDQDLLLVPNERAADYSRYLV
ncbi:MAG: FkbM family methyltransferase [Acidobacteriota bacterium]|nr:FkbM family methyltransferase [Acidobacteriota bacterium]